MKITIGTFNLNNLFSRFNFYGVIDAIKKHENTIESKVKYEFSEAETYRIRTYKGSLVKGISPEDRSKLAERILSMDVDILGVQEVENIDILCRFNSESLSKLYPYQVLIEGNDNRLIDVGLLSKYPIGAITSWQKAVHKDEPSKLVFGRDLLEVEILSPDRKKVLFKVFNTHLKSNYVPYYEDPVTGKKKCNERRQMQSEVVEDIMYQRTKGKKCILLGDMNDSPDSEYLTPITESGRLTLINSLTSPTETRPPKKDTPMPKTTAWTHRFKESGKPAHYELYDHIGLSLDLANKQTGAWIDRRKNHSGDGSDHDPAWVELEL